MRKMTLGACNKYDGAAIILKLLELDDTLETPQDINTLRIRFGAAAAYRFSQYHGH